MMKEPPSPRPSYRVASPTKQDKSRRKSLATTSMPFTRGGVVGSTVVARDYGFRRLFFFFFFF